MQQPPQPAEGRAQTAVEETVQQPELEQAPAEDQTVHSQPMSQTQPEQTPAQPGPVTVAGDAKEDGHAHTSHSLQTTPDVQFEAWQRVENVLRSNFYNPDFEAAKLLFACVTAHAVADFPPAWLLMIAPPGSMKTAMLEALNGLPRIHFVDEVTPQTFLSGRMDEPGKQRKASSSLLHRIGKDGIMVNADFGTIMSMQPHTRKAILAQLRRIYDGHFSREFGTDENLNERSWQGRLTLLAGSTPEVDKYYSVFQSLGERFIRVRWDRAGGAEAAMQAMDQTDAVSVKLRRATKELFAPVFSAGKLDAPDVPRPFLERIAQLSEFIVRARADIPRNSYDHEITGEPIVESNTRFPQQLAQVARGWAALMGRSEVNEQDFALVKRAAFDCLPPVRAKVIRALMEGRKPHSIGIPKTTVSRVLEDLEAVDLVHHGGEWELSDCAVDLLKALS